MRKLFVLYILSILALYSCSDDTIRNNNDYNPVKGEWNIYTENGDLLHSRVYTENYEAYFSVINGILQESPEKESYRIENNSLYFGSYSQTFEIIEDTLWITNSKQDQITKYIRRPITPIE